MGACRNTAPCSSGIPAEPFGRCCKTSKVLLVHPAKEAVRSGQRAGAAGGIVGTCSPPSIRTTSPDRKTRHETRNTGPARRAGASSLALAAPATNGSFLPRLRRAQSGCGRHGASPCPGRAAAAAIPLARPSSAAGWMWRPRCSALIAAPRSTATPMAPMAIIPPTASAFRPSPGWATRGRCRRSWRWGWRCTAMAG